MLLPILDTRFSIAGGLGMLLLLGCLGGCGMSFDWDTRKELIEIQAEGIQRLSLKTINGQIRVRGSEASDDLIQVTAIIEGGASGPAEVEACLDAIEITITDVDAETPQISWRWRDDHRSRWSCRVSFDAIVPNQLGIVAETQNGAVDVMGAAGESQLKSQNGLIHTQGCRSSLRAETHNGRLDVVTAALDVQLSTHNGAIDVRLRSPGPINGKVETHNGSIDLAVDPASSTITARSKQGRIESGFPLDGGVSKRDTTVSNSGSKAGKLEVSTHNGSITLRAIDADVPLAAENTEENAADTSDEVADEVEEEPEEPEKAAVESDGEASSGEGQPDDSDSSADDDRTTTDHSAA